MFLNFLKLCKLLTWIEQEKHEGLKNVNTVQWWTTAQYGSRSRLPHSAFRPGSAEMSSYFVSFPQSGMEKY
jgi:hypothetical protein